MKISARNVLKGNIVEVKTGAATAHVCPDHTRLDQARLDVGGTVVTASINKEAAVSPALTDGLSAYAVVKASDVMIGIA